ncbi:MAG: lysine--tRNA ligase [Candidatus Magasanikbacteria bacterium CG11_big_fil_rev_8_21_14_0_20_39_34]|uniref:Lysine--tRNA ligase n=1 Tax=Candidatus Magasanikbacteria bacterium CG11_big_fil_rev_8_21_14_0_20_39_34 TaxID=1974653 RepID=A0A2H0N5E7_9BACT|nr:MAG: lysine--tRNA ligase [Candidatus Magasanikbacteria bacterium CG11_big_fil_rev_8_21_14_0_20_39_34]
MNEQPININDEREVRLRKLHDLLDAGINPYPAQADRKQTVQVAFEASEGSEVTVVGRVVAKRDMGKITFSHVQDMTGKIQIALQKDILGPENYAIFAKKIDIGDFVSFTGERFVTHKGEESIKVISFTLLTKSLRPLPDKFYGLQDEETRLRKRYLDLLSHPELRDMFTRKARFWQSMREFLIQEGFLEVETPVLETTPGGADATPFITHHNALDIDVYLRISMGELWQKRLMVGGFEKTFEIGRQFRNEGMSREHLQDYTQMEFYWAYSDYKKGMDLVERLYKHTISSAFGTLQFEQIGEFKNIDLSGEWKHIDYRDTILEYTGVDILEATEDELKDKLRELSQSFEEFAGKGRLIDSLWKFCRKKIQGPVFLVNLPVEVSPLAKRQKENPKLTERYQVIIAGSEIGNGYSELNDPIDQAGRFLEQAKMREAGDTEAQMHDADFVEALEYGMPPTTGFGVSERLFSFLENKPIRECVLFPLMRPEDHRDSSEKKAKTMAAHAIILNDGQQPQWSLLNTAAHLSASFAARSGKELFEISESHTKDGVAIPMNIRHAIVMKQTDSREHLRLLKQQAEDGGFLVTCFTEEMRDSSNDKKVEELQSKKNLDEIQFLGILIYGEMKSVQKVTEKFDLWK